MPDRARPFNVFQVRDLRGQVVEEVAREDDDEDQDQDQDEDQDQDRLL